MKRLGKRFASVFIILFLVLVSGTPQGAVFAQSAEYSWAEDIPAMLAEGNYAEGEAIVCVASSDNELSGDQLLSESEALMNVSEEDLAGEVRLLYIQRADMTTEDILNRLAHNRQVIYAEPNYTSISTVHSAYNGPAEEELSVPADVRTEDIADLTSLQWSSSDAAAFHIEGNENASMHVPNFGTTESNMNDEVIVAVLDDAIDYRHPDLANRLYHFSQEEQAALGCGEWGYNATAQSSDGIPVYWAGQTHGTHCAGIIGAEWDSKGLSGVGSNVKLLSIQILVDDGYTSLVNCLRAFGFVDRARTAGINIDLTSNSYSMIQESRALNAAVEKLGEKWGIVTVFAAGNDDRELSTIGETPGTMHDNPYVITVASTDSSGSRSPFSNFAQGTVDLGAPGSGIISTVTLGYAEYFADAVPSTNKYYEGFENGSSALTVTQIDSSEEPLSAVVSVTDKSHFFGSYGLKVERDPDYDLPDAIGNKELTLLLDLGDVSAYGVQPGDFFGFAAGGTGSVQIGHATFTDAETGMDDYLFRRNRPTVTGNSWINVYYVVPENIDLTHFQIIASFSISSDMDTLFLDSFGFGTEKVPYAIFDGTSMATPAVAGAGAVLKSQHPEAHGIELVRLIKAMVTPEPSLEGTTRTGGRLDFLVSPVETPAPVINHLEVDGKTVIIKGSGFTDSGKVTLTKDIAGKEPEEKAASVSSWTDTEIVLTLEEEFKGILQAVLENSNQKRDICKQFINKSENIYEEDLPFNKSTGEPFVFDEGIDWETDGPLIGLEDKLYYLPALTKYEMSPAHQKMLCYDINAQTWTETAPLPEPLEYVSAAAHEGKIVVKGSTMDLLPDGSPQASIDPQVAVYTYDPITDSWSRASAEGVSPMDTLACSDDGQLILAGGGGFDPDAMGGQDDEVELPATIRYFDPSTGAGEKIADMHDVLYRPKVACRDSVIYAFDPNGYTLERIQNGKSELLENALPEYLVVGEGKIIPDLEDTERNGVLLAVSEGILFIGPAAKDGSSDTYILRDGSDRFEPYEKRMSDSKVSFTAAAYYRGYVYAIGSAIYEEKDRFFRATLVDVPESPDDVPPEPPIIPKTADDNSLLLWILLIAAALGTALGGGLLYHHRKGS